MLILSSVSFERYSKAYKPNKRSSLLTKSSSYSKTVSGSVTVVERLLRQLNQIAVGATVSQSCSYSQTSAKVVALPNLQPSAGPVTEAVAPSSQPIQLQTTEELILSHQLIL